MSKHPSVSLRGGAAIFAALCGAYVFASISPGAGNAIAFLAGSPSPARTPAVTITFPPTQSATDAEQITVHGTAIRETDNLSVNGVPATWGPDGATWHATVPLTWGDSRLHITQDGAAVAAGPTVTVRRTPLLERPNHLAIGGDKTLIVVDDRGGWQADDGAMAPASGLSAADDFHPGALAYISETVMAVADPRAGMIYLVDLPTGARTPLSGAGAGSGPPIRNPQGLALDAEKGRLLVLDRALPGVISLQIKDGKRRILSGPQRGRGPLPDVADDMAWDTTQQRVLIVDALHDDRLLAIDLSSGNRKWLPIDGSPELHGVGAIAVDRNDSTVYVVDILTGSILSIHPDSGRIKSESGPCADPRFRTISPAAAALDGSKSLLIADRDRHMVVRRTLGTDHCALAAGTVLGTGQPFRLVQDLRRGAGARALVALQAARPQLMTVDPHNGNREAVGGDGGLRGTLPSTGHTSALALAPDNQRAFILGATGRTRPALYQVEMSSGVTNKIFEDWGDYGPEFQPPHRNLLEYSAPLDSLILATPWIRRDKTLHAFDGAVGLAVADRRPFVVAGKNTGRGPLMGLNQTRVAALDPTGSHLIVADAKNRVVGIDLAERTRKLLHDGGAPSKAKLELPAPAAAATDASGAVLFAVDSMLNTLLAFDTRDGSVRVISGPSKGAGPAIHAPVGLVVDSDLQVAYLYDQVQQGLMAIDLASGSRVLVSR